MRRCLSNVEPHPRWPAPPSNTSPFPYPHGIAITYSSCIDCLPAATSVSKTIVTTLPRKNHPDRLGTAYPASRTRRFERRAFSLIELLAVLAILSIMASFVAPAMSSVINGRSTSRAADQTMNAALLARQISLANRCPVALVISRPATVSGKTQAILILASRRDASGTLSWSAVGGWTKVPDGSVLEPYKRDGEQSFYAAGQNDLSGILPVRLDGLEVSAYDYIMFHPDGIVDAPKSAPAVIVSSALRTSARQEYTIVVQSETGRPKVLPN